MVHGVYDQKSAGLSEPRSSVSLESFRSNILSVARSYSFVSMDEVAGMIFGKEPWRKRSLALTFDDSLKCHSEITAPKLAEWGVPGTFYLSSETIDSQNPYWWLRLEFAMSRARKQHVCLELPGGVEVKVDTTNQSRARQILSAAIRSTATPKFCEMAVDSVETQLGVDSSDIRRLYPPATPMTWEDARKLKSLGMTIGSHTVSHPNLTLIDANQLREEFSLSRRRIEEACGIPCHHLCYPHGYHSEAVCQQARAAGYETAVTTEDGWCHARGSDLFSLSRITLPGDSMKLGYLIARELVKKKK